MCLQSVLEKWRPLFQWLHDQGFWNSLLMDDQGNTLAMDHFTSKLLSNVVSVEEFFHLSMMWPDLHGYPVHVTMANDPPRALVFHDKNNKLKFAGFIGTIITTFAEFYNASLVVHKISDLDYYHEMDCLKYIENSEVDVCGDGMALNPYSTYVITNPLEIFPSNLVVPYGKPLPRFYYFLKPFQRSLWGLIFITFIYIMLALSFIHRLQKGSWSMSCQLQYAVLPFINMPLELRRVKGPLKTYLEIVFIVKGFVVSNLYFSLLTSLLYSRLYYQEINSIEDLRRLNISIMVNDFEYEILKAVDLDPIVEQQLLLASDEDVFLHRRSLDTNYAYYSQFDKNYFYLYQQRFLLRPRMKELSKVPVHNVMGGLPIRFNWPFEHLLNNVFRCIRDTGLFRHFLEESYEDGIRSGYLKYFPNEHPYVEPLTLEYFQLSVILLAGGYMLGFLSFFIEILVFKKFGKN